MELLHGGSGEVSIYVILMKGYVQLETFFGRSLLLFTRRLLLVMKSRFTVNDFNSFLEDARNLAYKLVLKITFWGSVLPVFPDCIYSWPPYELLLGVCVKSWQLQQLHSYKNQMVSDTFWVGSIKQNNVGVIKLSFLRDRLLNFRIWKGNGENELAWDRQTDSLNQEIHSSDIVEKWLLDCAFGGWLIPDKQ